MIVTSVDPPKTITELDTVTISAEAMVMDVRVSDPLDTAKREYPIEESDGVNAMEDILRSDPVELKRKEVNEAEEENGLVTIPSPSGLMFTIP